MSLRSLLLVLILLNVVAFAGGRMGWLGSPATRGEPERLTNQIRPDAIEIGGRTDAAVAPAPRPAPTPSPAPVPRAEAPAAAPVVTASPAPVAPSVPVEAERCAAYIVRGLAGLDEAIRIADQTGRFTASRQTLEEPTHWRVRIPPAASQDAAEERLRTLRARGVDDMYIIRGEGPNRWSISLGLFSTENAALQRLASLREKGFTSAEIIPGTIGRFWVEFRGGPLSVETLAGAIESWLGPDTRRACSP